MIYYSPAQRFVTQGVLTRVLTFEVRRFVVAIRWLSLSMLVPPSRHVLPPLLDNTESFVAPAVVELIAIKEVRKCPAELGMRGLDLGRGGILHVQEAKGLAHSVEEGHSVRDGKPPPAPCQDEGGFEQPKLLNRIWGGSSRSSYE